MNKIKTTRAVLDTIDGIIEETVQRALKIYTGAEIANDPVKAYEIAFEESCDWAYQTMEGRFEF